MFSFSIRIGRRRIVERSLEFSNCMREMNYLRAMCSFFFIFSSFLSIMFYEWYDWDSIRSFRLSISRLPSSLRISSHRELKQWEYPRLVREERLWMTWSLHVHIKIFCFQSKVRLLDLSLWHFPSGDYSRLVFILTVLIFLLFSRDGMRVKGSNACSCRWLVVSWMRLVPLSSLRRWEKKEWYPICLRYPLVR